MGALQASWWQEHGAAHDGGPRAQQAGKLETRALFAGSQGGTVTPAGGHPTFRLNRRGNGSPTICRLRPVEGSNVVGQDQDISGWEAPGTVNAPTGFRTCRRSDRQRLRRELSAAGRKRHRFRHYGAHDGWQVAGAAQSSYAIPLTTFTPTIDQLTFIWRAIILAVVGAVILARCGRRLHHRIRVHELYRQSKPLCEDPVRSFQGLRARDAGCGFSQRADRASLSSGEDSQGAHR